MRYLIISDVHSNLEALEAVLAAADDLGYERVLVLGDLVGYGGQPNEVVERVRALKPFAIIRGNHDKVAAGLGQSDGFNVVAQESAAWTSRTLTPENLAYLAACPPGPLVLDDGIEICHGSPADEDEYISSQSGAMHALQDASAPVCFYGHTHIPVVFRLSATGLEWVRDSGPGKDVALQPGVRYLINPGSVGQPRDGDPRAAFALLDTARHVVTFHRLAYDVERAQAHIEQAGLPEALARRLSFGR